MDGDAARQRAAQRNEEMMGASEVECTESSAVQRRGSASLGDDRGCGAGRWLIGEACRAGANSALKATRDLVAVRVASYESIAGFSGANFGEWVWAWCLEEMRSSRNVDQEGPSLSNPGDGVDAPIAALSLSNRGWGAKRSIVKIKWLPESRESGIRCLLDMSSWQARRGMHSVSRETSKIGRLPVPARALKRRDSGQARRSAGGI
ncbi:hypothetical protein SCAR479_12215 [Seiridium cardinale]|uniref:Uncharacterized protein n=1 Tax=Seiridium cardinale TaxID=138064 RepID=A0ABR2XBB7_9PEZI